MNAQSAIWARQKCAGLLSHDLVHVVQEALQAHQRHFVWSEGAEGGVLANIEHELSMRAQSLTGTAQSVII